MTSEHLHRQLVEHKVIKIRFAEPVQRLEPNGVWLASGALIPGCATINGRGPRNSRQLILGFQKFLGLEIQLERSSRLRGPIITDATVSQQDGYRFLYVLSLAQQRILMEDTRYSDGADLDETTLRQDVLSYVHRQGWRMINVKRSERGVLPILLTGDLPAFWAERVPG